jgi:hypothetical protein
MPSPEQSPQPPARRRKHHLPLGEVEPGMILGEAVVIAERDTLRLRLPADHELTETNLRQLGAYHAEFVCVSLPDPRNDEEVAADTAAAATRVTEIFSGADLSQPAVAALLERVLAYRSA